MPAFLRGIKTDHGAGIFFLPVFVERHQTHLHVPLLQEPPEKRNIVQPAGIFLRDGDGLRGHAESFGHAVRNECSLLSGLSDVRSVLFPGKEKFLAQQAPDTVFHHAGLGFLPQEDAALEPLVL